MSDLDAGGEYQNHAFAVFVLGELMDAPHPGYKLREILSRLLGPYHPINWVTLHPVILHLEQEGYIEQVPTGELKRWGERSADRQQFYAITDVGRQRFHTLMVTPEDYTLDYRESFIIKLLYLRFLSPREQFAILAHCLEYLRRERAHRQHVFSAQSTTAALPADQREPIFRMTRFCLTGTQAEIEWVEEEMAQIKEHIDEQD
jgi:DNA-binding PadR family transcriptional regulator